MCPVILSKPFINQNNLPKISPATLSGTIPCPYTMHKIVCTDDLAAYFRQTISKFAPLPLLTLLQMEYMSAFYYFAVKLDSYS